MGEKNDVAGQRHVPDLRPEFLVLGFLAEGPAHGYELFRRFRISLDGLWHISESQFYSILKRAEKHGLLVSPVSQEGERATRRLLSLSSSGRRLLDDWIRQPTPSSPRLIHLEFMTRIFFARRLFPKEVVGLIADQISILSNDLDRLRPMGKDSLVIDSDEIDSLSTDFRMGQLQAVLDWLKKNAGLTG